MNFKNFNFKTTIIVLDLFIAQNAFAEKGKENLKYDLNDSGTHFFQVTFLNQTWMRFNQSNPNTLTDGKLSNQTFDIGLRRTRMQLFGQITDRTFLYFQFGQNNFNAQSNYNGNRKVAAFFHDALGEYRVSKNNALKLGAGLTIANGLSRFSQPSIGTILTMDVPVFAQTTVNQTDQFSRKLSMYAIGQIGHLDYRVILSDPFPVSSNGSTSPAISKESTFAGIGRSKQYQTYLMWQFFEHEPNTTPFMTGSYLGKKKIFNIAVGAIYQSNAMWHLNNTNDTIYESMMHLAVESFLDMPLNKTKQNAINAYLGYFNTNYGNNYLRYNGLMNPSTGTNLAAPNSIGTGAMYGNAIPMFGTGQVIYTQIGYLFPKDFLSKSTRIGVYASTTAAKYNKLANNKMVMLNGGINWYLHGNMSKLTLDWQNRPTYYLSSNQVLNGSRKNTITFQFQVSI